MTHPNTLYMQYAIDLARKARSAGYPAVSAIVVRDDTILSEAISHVDEYNDPTSHAEMNAIRIACEKIGNKKLENCYLYTTYEPCSMCTSAVILAHMAGIVFGATIEDQEACGYPQKILLHSEDVIKNSTRKVELFGGFMRDECIKVLKGI